MPQDWFTFCCYCITSFKHIAYNLFIVFIIIGVIIATIYAESPHHEVNLTKEMEATGHLVPEMVISQIRSKSFFENSHMYDYIRRIAWVESRDGLDSKTYIGDYHGGLWKVDEQLFLVTKNISYPNLIKKHDLVMKWLNVDWLELQWESLRIPLLSGLAISLYMYTIHDEMPSSCSITKQADHWNRNYNSKKEYPRIIDDFLAEVETLKATTSGMYVSIANIYLKPLCW